MEMKDRLARAMAGPPKVSQAALARAVKVSQPTVNDWLSGRSETIRGPAVVAVARHLNVSADWLLTGRGQMRPSTIQRERHVTNDVDSRNGSQSLRMDRVRIRDAVTMLKHLGELQGVPSLSSDPEAIAIAYDFLVEFDTPVEPSNILDMTKRLAATLRGELNDDEGEPAT